jgi:hypothetical protein
LIYLGEGRYLDASLSLMSMVPVVGDIGKWSLKIGQEFLDEATEKVVKTVSEAFLEKVTKESLEEVAEKALKATTEELLEKTTKESLEELAERTLKETNEGLAEQVSQMVVEKTNKEITDGVSTKVVKDTVEAAPAISAEKVTKTGAEEKIEEILGLVNQETAQLINNLRVKYGDEMVGRFLPLCEKYGINPHDILTRPPTEGQSLIGWVLGIENPMNPVNHALVNLNLTNANLDNILKESVVRPDSKVVVLGYGKGVEKPYYTLSDEIKGCHLSLSAEVWAPFETAKANFWADINTPLIEKALEDRKIFLFNINYDVIVDPVNVERFSLPELRLIEMEKNNYINVPFGDYTACVPIELLDTYRQYLPDHLLN